MTSMRPAHALKMKDLERATGVGRETIRFYIREGLLPEPARPGRNVAWYDGAFIERIQLIKELQQKRFLPLHAITIKNFKTGMYPGPITCNPPASHQCNQSVVWMKLVDGNPKTIAVTTLRMSYARRGAVGTTS